MADTFETTDHNTDACKHGVMRAQEISIKLTETLFSCFDLNAPATADDHATMHVAMSTFVAAVIASGPRPIEPIIEVFCKLLHDTVLGMSA